MAIIERKRLEWSAQGLARSPVWMLQSDDRPNRTALNSLHDKDGQRNCCHSALGHLTLPKGATTWGIPVQVFFRIKVPQIKNTIMVVWTTITIVVLKVFDIVFAMTNGQWQTQVLANYMFDKLFRANDWGVGSASAMVIMLLVSPILVWNVRNARREMQ